MRKIKSIKVRGFKRPETGIFLGSGKNWVLLNDNPIDFIIDGYLLIRKENILREVRSDDLELTTKVLRLKGELSEASFFSFNLNSDHLLFDKLLKDECLIQICFHNQDSTLVGRVISVKPDRFRMRLLSRKGEWLKEFNFRYNKLRTINVGSDYLKSLELLTKSDQP